MQQPALMFFGSDDDPALTRAAAIARRAKASNFFWDSPLEVHRKVLEELDEVATAANDLHREEEIGDALFTLACLAYAHGIDPEAALQKANDKLIGRWQKVFELAEKDGKKPDALSPDELENYWIQVKN